MISFWEKESLLTTDIAIIGGGIVGLSVAASIAESDPEKKITVFERSVLPYGASTRNAGFACFGSPTELLSDIEIMGEVAARNLVFERWLGLEITKKRLGERQIGFESNGGYELLKARDEDVIDKLNDLNSLVADFLPDYFKLNPEGAARLGMSLKKGERLVSISHEGQVDTGKLMAALESYVLSLGVLIRTGANILHFEESNNAIELQLKDSHRGEVSFKAQQLVICNNAFAKNLLPETQMQPGRGQVLITKPIQNLPFRGNLHMDQGFYYLRNVHDRLLFGGARNLAMEEEKTTVFELNDRIHLHLEEELKKLFPTLNMEIDQRWSGIMAFGENKLPIVSAISDRVKIAVKMSGMGIALAGFIGESVKEMLE